MSRPTRDGTNEPISWDQILRREREQGNIHASCPADREQDWQPYLVDPYSVIIQKYDIMMIQCVTGVGDTEGRRRRDQEHLPAAATTTLPG